MCEVFGGRDGMGVGGGLSANQCPSLKGGTADLGQAGNFFGERLTNLTPSSPSPPTRSAPTRPMPSVSEDFDGSGGWGNGTFGSTKKSKRNSCKFRKTRLASSKMRFYELHFTTLNGNTCISNFFLEHSLLFSKTL